MSNSNNIQAIAVRVLKNPSDPVASKYNGAMRQSVTVQIGDEIVQIWENCPTRISAWKSATTQYVRKNHRGYYESVESYGEANAAFCHSEGIEAADVPNAARVAPVAPVAARYAPHVVSVEPSDETKRQALEYIKFHTKVYASIFGEVQKKMQRFGLDVKEEKDIATTVYIQTVRKFNI